MNRWLSLWGKMSTKVREGWVPVHLATISTSMLCWGMISIEAEGGYDSSEFKGLDSIKC